MEAAQPSDRISDFPDEILLHILSFLPDSRLAFQTSVLSTRWRHLPSHCPVIRLPFQDGDKSTKIYMRTVNGCLRALRAPNLHYLQTEIPNHPNAATAIDRWIRLASEHSLRELHLSTVSYLGRRPLHPCFLDHGTAIPSSVFSSSLSLSLTSLHVNDCPFGHFPDSFQGFSFLRELSISNSRVDDRHLAQLLRYCPVLETLHLIRLSNCQVLILVPASVPNLKHLRIVMFQDRKEKAVVVEALGLRSLSIEGRLGDFLLNDCPLLTDVKIYGHLSDHIKYHSDIRLLSSVSLVHRISVDDWFFQVEFVRSNFPNNSVAVFENLKKLCCDVDCVTDSMLGAFPSILEECPLLVELRVKIKEHKKVFQSDQQNKQGIEYCHSHQSWMKTSSEFMSIKLNFYDDLEQDGCGSSELSKGIWKSSHQLKYAVVQGFLGSKNEARLLQFLLRHATTLEKLIVIGFHIQFCDQTMVHQLLSHFCQGFPHVQIMQQFQKL